MVGERTSRVWGPVLAVVLSLTLVIGYLLVAHDRGWLDRALCEGDCPVDGPLDDVRVSAIEAAELGSPTRPMSAEAVADALGDLLDDERLGTVSLTVDDAVTGERLFEYAADEPMIPASSQKVLTSFAALEVLGPRDRFTTSVRLDGETLVLVGGGDPLLADEHDEESARASLEELARLAAEELRDLGIGEVGLAYDRSYFSSEDWHPQWPDQYRGSGAGARMSALRLPPTSGRDAEDPTLDAAEAFAEHLEAAGVEIVGDPQDVASSAGAVALVELEGSTVGDAVERSILVSDNYVTEVLGHHVALAQGRPADHADAAAAVEDAIDRALGRQDGLDVVDTSGLARDNRVTTDTFAQVLRAAVDDPLYAPLFVTMPISGYSGSLAPRFGAADTEDATGLVRAKTGSLTGVRSLTGTYATVDGGAAVFSLIANDIPEGGDWLATTVIDEILAALVACTCT